MERNRMMMAVAAVFATLLTTACGTGAGGVCDQLVDCDYIDEDDFDSCKADISGAVKDGDIDRTDVKDCEDCSRDSGCGFELLTECFSDCGDVWAEIDGSGIESDSGR